MTGPSVIVWDPALIEYNFGRSHPMSPIRVELTMALVRDLGLLDVDGVRLVDPVDGEPFLATVHDQDYIDAVRSCNDGQINAQCLRYGLGTSDDPVFEHIHTASARIVGASVAGAREVWSGRALHAVNFAGGLHHAMRDRASGFCIYNDAAAAIVDLLAAGTERVAYVDIDVHHGDGVQAAFYDDPRVLTISLHESPTSLFPGTGWPYEIGGPNAEGYSVNLPLPAGTADAGWLRAFHAVVPELLEEFRPQVVVSQHGCDTHVLDPLANLALTIDGQRAAYAAIHQWAHEYAEGRWVALGGGGYAIVEVVPRAWSHLVGQVVGEPVDPQLETPQGWRDFVAARTGRTAPLTMTDGADASYSAWIGGYDPGNELDRAVMATRSAVFPFHGLAP